MTTTLFPQPIDYMTFNQLRRIARHYQLSYLTEQSHNSQTKEVFVTAVKAA